MNKEKKLSELNPFEDIDYKDRDRPLANIVSYNRNFVIIEGYKTSAKLLINAVTSGDELPHECVYPLIFTCRHSIELLLKQIINVLLKVYSIRAGATANQIFCDTINKSLGIHSIEGLVDSFKKLQNFDSDIKATFKELEGFDLYIQDYYFDVESDAFRYAYKKNSNTLNLGGITTIDIGIWYAKYEALMKQLDYFYYYFCDLLLREQSTGTFTRELSRSQIELISKKISFINLSNFDAIKDEIKTEYNLSSRKFSVAIDVIKKHREFSANTGIEIKFGDIKEETIRDLCYLLKLKHKISSIKPKSKKSIFDSDDYSKKNKELKDSLENELEEKGISLISIIGRKEVNELLAFYEMSPRFNNYSEDLDNRFNFWQKQMSKDYMEHKYYILSNLYVADFAASFKMCGQITYLKWFEKYLKQKV